MLRNLPAEKETHVNLFLQREKRTDKIEMEEIRSRNLKCVFNAWSIVHNVSGPTSTFVEAAAIRLTFVVQQRIEKKKFLQENKEKFNFLFCWLHFWIRQKLLSCLFWWLGNAHITMDACRYFAGLTHAYWHGSKLIATLFQLMFRVLPTNSEGFAFLPCAVHWSDPWAQRQEIYGCFINSYVVMWDLM